jgi:uncharacterized protein
MTGGRPAPAITPHSEPFWRGGADGILQLQRCQTCGRWLHPPRGSCPSCLTGDLLFEETSGIGTVWSFTINRLARSPEGEEDPIVAQVELSDQPGLLLLTNLVHVSHDDVAIGMPVHVEFDNVDDVWVPVFAP